jgi:ABC-2 type transport system permease protein
MFGGGGGPQPKGDMNELWRVLGINSPGQPGMMGGFNPDIAWQSYNPYPKLQIQGIPDTWVFASNAAEGGEDSINADDSITRGLEQILFPMPATIEPAADADPDLKFTPLVKTSSFAGTIGYEDVRRNQQTPERMSNLQIKSGSKVLAARIRSESGTDDDQAEAEDETPDDENAEGEVTDTDSEDTDPEDADSEDAEASGINVVYVSDIDLMINAFLRIRARPDEDEEINWRFENVNFLLNIIDVLSGNDQYVEIRRRKPHHSTLKVVEAITREARAAEFEERVKFEQEFDNSIKETQEKHDEVLKEFKDKVDDLKKRQEEGEEISITEFNVAQTQLAIKEQQLQQKLDVEREAAERARDAAIEKKRRETDLAILRTQNEFKAWAVAIPPILPLIVGVVVFVMRRLREREGVAKSRLR